MPAIALLPSLLHLLAPERCPGCDELLGDHRALFCPACDPLLERVSAPEIPTSAAAAFLYGGPIAAAIQRLKYAGRGELARPLGSLLADFALLFAGRVDRVVPVPLHPRRLRARGFNQSALLARPVAAALGLPLDARALARVRPTRDQAALSREARSHNLRGAFAARNGQRADRVLLIDDVRTTGATLAEAADALVRGGCAQVHTLALARAL
jgi:ComF family protein